jgi:TetR/AcrR family transcriptional regulator, cholesterol catabolism regulator
MRSATKYEDQNEDDAPLAKAEGSDRGNVQTLKRRLVREEILRSAARLFAAQGVRGVSIEKVAAGLGYTKSSIYYYFSSKDDLLWAVFDYISYTYLERARQIVSSHRDPVARLSELIRMHVRFLADNTAWTTIFYRDVESLAPARQAAVRSTMQQYNDYFRQAVDEGIAQDLISPLSSEMVVNAVLGACNWMVNWISERHRDSVDEIAETYVKLFSHGFVAIVPATPVRGPP